MFCRTKHTCILGQNQPPPSPCKQPCTDFKSGSPLHGKGPSKQQHTLGITQRPCYHRARGIKKRALQHTFSITHTHTHTHTHTSIQSRYACACQARGCDRAGRGQHGAAFEFCHTCSICGQLGLQGLPHLLLLYPVGF